MNQRFHNKRQLVWEDYSIYQKNFTGHMFHIKVRGKVTPLPVNQSGQNTDRVGCALLVPPYLCASQAEGKDKSSERWVSLEHKGYRRKY